MIPSLLLFVDVKHWRLGVYVFLVQIIQNLHGLSEVDGSLSMGIRPMFS
jgi:hypothetical protein